MTRGAAPGFRTAEERCRRAIGSAVLSGIAFDVFVAIFGSATRVDRALDRLPGLARRLPEDPADFDPE